MDSSDEETESHPDLQMPDSDPDEETPGDSKNDDINQNKTHQEKESVFDQSNSDSLTNNYSKKSKVYPKRGQ